jgi:ABC-type branched-subunit amino acid transport system ATPase component
MRAVESLPPDLAILLVEHDMDLVFRFAREIVVLVAGAILTTGSPDQISRDPRVRDIYFGHRHARR